jgi:hypothetical protein
MHAYSSIWRIFKLWLESYPFVKLSQKYIHKNLDLALNLKDAILGTIQACLSVLREELRRINRYSVMKPKEFSFSFRINRGRTLLTIVYSIR